MAIKIIDEYYKDTDVYLTRQQFAQYQEEYKRTFMFYSGVAPTFEEWVYSQKLNENKTLLNEDGGLGF